MQCLQGSKHHYSIKKKKEKREKESEYMKEEMTKGCKQPASRVTHADPILLLRPYKYGTNGL